MRIVGIFAALFCLGLAEPSAAGRLPLEKIKLPAGFKISVYAEGVENARSMALGPSGTLYVGTRNEGKVYAVLDKDKDFKADEILVLAEGLNMPNGVAFRDGSLWFTDNGRDWMGDDLPPDELNRAPKAGMYFGYPYCHGAGLRTRNTERKGPARISPRRPKSWGPTWPLSA